MNPCDPLGAIRYYNELKKDTVDCFAQDVASKVHFSSVVVDTDEILIICKKGNEGDIRRFLNDAKMKLGDKMA